jgi:hypothetical protein
MKYIAVVVLGVLGMLEFILRAVFVIIMTLTIFGIIVICDDFLTLITPVTLKLAQEIASS